LLDLLSFLFDRTEYVMDIVLLFAIRRIDKPEMKEPEERENKKESAQDSDNS
jgi:hypothetical protein